MKKLAIIDDYERAALRMADWSPLEGDVEIDVFHDHVADEDRLAERLRPYHIICIMRERTPFSGSLLARLPKLEHLYTSGMRNFSIDLDAARRRHVAVTGTPTLPYPAAEHAWALLLALAKRVVTEDAATRSGHWGTGLSLGLRDKTLGIVGLGKLGRQVARIGQAFGMRVVAWSHNLTTERCRDAGVGHASKARLFSDSDFVTIHVPLGDRYRSLVGAAELESMRPTAFLINTSRGPVVDEHALLAALQQGSIAGAGLDVFDVEPLPPDHPLKALPNVVITPHQGYVTVENFRLFFEGAVANIRSWLDGATVNALS